MGPADPALLEDEIGYRFTNRELLLQALRHSSACVDTLGCNERLEFLGDAVLSLVSSEHLFRTFGRCREGDLTRIKSFAVSTAALDRRGRALHLDQYADLGGGLRTGSPLPPRVHANLLEAVIAAIYLDGGWEPARRFVLDQLLPEIDRMLDQGHDRNFKSILQQHCQQEFSCAPKYRLVSARGPDHKKCFEVHVQVANRSFEPGVGASKKEAEQAAAEIALAEMGVLPGASASDGTSSTSGDGLDVGCRDDA